MKDHVVLHAGDLSSRLPHSDKDRRALIETPNDFGVGVIDSLGSSAVEPLEAGYKLRVFASGDSPVHVDGFRPLGSYRLPKGRQPDVDDRGAMGQVWSTGVSLLNRHGGHSLLEGLLPLRYTRACLHGHNR
jgi:hypothetical protein